MKPFALTCVMGGSIIAASIASAAERPAPQERAPLPEIAGTELLADATGFRIEPVRHRRYYYGPGYYMPYNYGSYYYGRPYYYGGPYYSRRPYYYGRPYWDHGNMAPGVYWYNF
jgi:hypothetical protein